MPGSSMVLNAVQGRQDIRINSSPQCWPVMDLIQTRVEDWATDG